MGSHNPCWRCVDVFGCVVPPVFAFLWDWARPVSPWLLPSSLGALCPRHALRYHLPSIWRRVSSPSLLKRKVWSTKCLQPMQSSVCGWVKPEGHCRNVCVNTGQEWRRMTKRITISPVWFPLLTQSWPFPAILLHYCNITWMPQHTSYYVIQ